MAWAASSAQLLFLFLLVSTCFLPTLSQQTNNSSVAVHSPLPQFSFSFNFTNPSNYDQSTDILLEGDAKVNGKLIDLTCDSFEQSSDSCTGRMSYRHPVPLYDDTTLASFSTSFTFQILFNKSLASMPPGDGIAFFLTGFPSSMPPRSEGQNLGLVSNDAAPYGPQQFVAVEFDTFYQNFDIPDPKYYHIGIDINSVHSKNTTMLPSPLELEGNMTATVKFDNITQILVASLKVGSHPEPIVVTSQLPDLRTLLPREVAVGFSASTGAVAELHQILAWSFNSTLVPTIPRKGHDNKTTILIIIGGLVLLVVVVWLILSCWKWINRHRGIEKQGKQGPTRFKYQDLAAATDNFCEERKLGQGFFGVVYRGYLKKLGCDVAVKEILNKSNVVPGPNNDSHFYAELNAITSVKHKNLVKLVGWCRGSSCNFVEFMCWCWKNKTNNRLFLVYELVPKGNLHDNLHKEETLPWETRSIRRTEAYLDPQCKKPVGMVEFSRSSDVYSFGILLLEIACGEQGGMLIREKVWQLYINRSLLRAADDRLKGEFSISEMETVLILGLWCSYLDNNKRPSMEQVMAVLEHGKQLPDLNSLDTTSVSAQMETYIDPQAPTSAASSSYEQMHE
ncbi:unnamed protein product [Miscanthus lutarioriparius]|uniref:non-specific serine/threonine protein kinase n=1 Tax=Miscanthus lutarioriparius TaxID=422564 RepID=A0A811QA47_9POAL|nr:unnamed protein product [Miscanthus lutarioriparius]